MLSFTTLKDGMFLLLSINKEKFDNNSLVT